MSSSSGTILPLHWKAHNVLREVVHTRTRRSALVVLFTISLVFVILIILDYPIYPFSLPVSLSPEYTHPFSHPTDIYEVADGVSIVQFSDIQDGLVYHSFYPNPPEHAIADHRVRPIRSHTQLSDGCIDHWVGTGRWDGPCAVQKVEDAVIDLVYVWINGS